MQLTDFNFGLKPKKNQDDSTCLICCLQEFNLKDSIGYTSEFKAVHVNDNCEIITNQLRDTH